MISRMANTKRFITSSISGQSDTSEARNSKPADFYLPQSICSKIDVDQVDEVTIQRKRMSDGRTHCTYSVRWKNSNPKSLGAVDAVASMHHQQIDRKQPSRSKAIEDMLSKDFYEMTKLDNLEIGQRLPSVRSYDHSFTETSKTGSKITAMGPAKSKDITKMLESRQFLLYYRRPDYLHTIDDIPLDEPLTMACRTGDNKIFHYRLCCDERSGQQFWRIDAGSSTTRKQLEFCSLESLVQYYMNCLAADDAI